LFVGSKSGTKEGARKKGNGDVCCSGPVAGADYEGPFTSRTSIISNCILIVFNILIYLS